MNKVHAFYRPLSDPSIVTLCGQVDCDHLLATNIPAKITCVPCNRLLTKHETRHNIVQLPESCPMCAGRES